MYLMTQKKMALPFKKNIYIILNKHAMFNLKFLVFNTSQHALKFV
jgi:hypothetical protein